MAIKVPPLDPGHGGGGGGPSIPPGQVPKRKRNTLRVLGAIAVFIALGLAASYFFA